MATLHPTVSPARRDSDREDLLRRVSAEFEEMPCLRLTAPQAQRLFGLPSDVCDDVLTALVDGGTLAHGSDGRYRLRHRLDGVTSPAVLDCYALAGPPGLLID
jgi:hypothetical protein